MSIGIYELVIWVFIIGGILAVIALVKSKVNDNLHSITSFHSLYFQMDLYE